MPIRTRRCTQCEQQKPLADFRQAGKEVRSVRCIQCRKTLLANLKKRVQCHRCKKSLPREQFKCAPNGRRLVTNCHECAAIAKAVVFKQGKREPAMSQDPCRNCQRYFRLVGYFARSAKVKYCSMDCVLEMKSQRPKLCIQCKQTKPLHAFDRHNTKFDRKGAKKARCRECYELAREQTHHKCQMWAQPLTARRAMRLHGQAHGKTDVSVELATWVIGQKCWLCGDGSRTARLKDTSQPWTKENAHPLCSLCSRLIQKGGVSTLLVQANRIAAWRPLERPGRPPGGGQ